MDLFVIASTVAGMPIGLLSTWIVDKVDDVLLNLSQIYSLEVEV